jgi:hypothetical protein
MYVGTPIFEAALAVRRLAALESRSQALGGLQAALDVGVHSVLVGAELRDEEARGRLGGAGRAAVEARQPPMSTEAPALATQAAPAPLTPPERREEAGADKSEL